jgi:hypothetical protein
MHDIKSAKTEVDDCPFDITIPIATKAYHLNTKTWVDCNIYVSSKTIPCVLVCDKEENLLEPNDDLLKLPSVYLTRRFRLMLSDAQKHLSKVEMDLVDTWNEFQGKNIKK